LGGRELLLPFYHYDGAIVSQACKCQKLWDTSSSGASDVIDLETYEADLDFSVGKRRMSKQVHPLADGAGPTRPLRVLMAEDDADSAFSMGMLLRLFGHEVEHVPDGLAALRKMESFGPDVVMLDIGLPKMDGYDVARQILASGKKRPLLIAVTGYRDAEHKKRCIEVGFDIHLLKPADPEYLQILLAKHRRALGMIATPIQGPS
jgi:CheY-like chemotaxis protein